MDARIVWERGCRIAGWLLVIAAAVFLVVGIVGDFAEQRRLDDARRAGCAPWEGQAYWEHCMATHEPD